jgi:hypothetical protein
MNSVALMNEHGGRVVSVRHLDSVQVGCVCVGRHASNWNMFVVREVVL